MQTTFDRDGATRFAGELTAEMDRCDTGEGATCSTLEATLFHYADLCCRYRDATRQWAQDVFAGRLPLDPDAEVIFRTVGQQLLVRARDMAVDGRKAEVGVPCYVLDSLAVLEQAIWQLHELLAGWVTPRLAVGPAARNRPPLTPDQLNAMRRRLDDLPQLPADWTPALPAQRTRFRRTRPT